MDSHETMEVGNARANDSVIVHPWIELCGAS